MKVDVEIYRGRPHTTEGSIGIMKDLCKLLHDLELGSTEIEFTYEEIHTRG
jgi:hypothetical protein